MVALKRNIEPTHYECGPTSQDIPLRIYTEEPSRPVPWWVELSLAVAFIVIVGLAMYGAATVAM